MFRDTRAGRALENCHWWIARSIPRGRYRLIGFDGYRWEYLDVPPLEDASAAVDHVGFDVPSRYSQVELLLDRRQDMLRSRQR